MQYSYAAKPGDDVYGRRLSLMADYNLLDQLPKVDGFYSLPAGGRCHHRLALHDD